MTATKRKGEKSRARESDDAATPVAVAPPPRPEFGGADLDGLLLADEVNRTSEWLAGMVRDRGLPQKLFVLHQFDAGMLAQRKNIVTDRPDLQVVLHADGHGTPPVKMETWRRLLDDLPAGVWMGWKNFYTEDTPTFSPTTTMAVAPTPWFVSYQ